MKTIKPLYTLLALLVLLSCSKTTPAETKGNEGSKENAPTSLSDEPSRVETPSTSNADNAAISDLITILVNQNGTNPKIVISLNDTEAVPIKDFRKKLILKAVDLYNNSNNGESIILNDSQINEFAENKYIGTPFNHIKDFLDLDSTGRDKFLSNLSDPKVGIPINDTNNSDNFNEFEIWLKAIKDVALDYRQMWIKEKGLDENADKERIDKEVAVYNSIMSGSAISIKADKETPFPTINIIMENLRNAGLNKFTLQTQHKE